MGWIVADAGKILHTLDGGQTWIQQNDDQGCAVGEKGVILKYGKSMQIDDQVPAAKQVSDFHLENNFPNPFNHSTTFNLHLHKPSSLKIVIYDILGREVKELMQQSIESGRFSVTWQGEDLNFIPCPSGIYFACFTIGDQKIYKKIFLLR